MKIFKSYGFWTAFAGAVVILVNALGELFGFSIESKLIENVIMAVAGVLVALGIVSVNKGKQEELKDVEAEEVETEEDSSQDDTLSTTEKQNDEE
ncbi:MAG: hypothetical protein IJX25_04685 [Clostridia bacterium]|nr:hypothetical protein [Clostridia bacterium]MBQ8792515.1 hypothetical protein [Clostridia bacterium]